MNMLDRARVSKAYETCCQLANMAGEARPNFVEWNRVYRTRDGNFRLVMELRGNGRTTEEDDNGRIVRLPKGQQFHDVIAWLERVK
jgi:hypothetical protein